MIQHKWDLLFIKYKKNCWRLRNFKYNLKMWCILFLCSSHQFWFPFSRVNTEVRLILKRRQEGGNSILFWIQDLTTTKNEVFETNISKLKRWTYYVRNEKIGKKSSNKKGKTTPYFRIQIHKNRFKLYVKLCFKQQ